MYIKVLGPLRKPKISRIQVDCSLQPDPSNIMNVNSKNPFSEIDHTPLMSWFQKFQQLMQDYLRVKNLFPLI